jgi:hypothetical protein
MLQVARKKKKGGTKGRAEGNRSRRPRREHASRVVAASQQAKQKRRPYPRQRRNDALVKAPVYTGAPEDEIKNWMTSFAVVKRLPPARE